MINVGSDPAQQLELTEEQQQENSESLFKAAEKKLEELANYQKVIDEFKSGYDLLLKRYQIDSSLFEKMSESYAGTPIYYKVCVGALVVGFCALIGAALNLTFLFAASAVGLVGVFSMLFSNHSASSKKKNERLEQDVTNMEASIKQEVETLSQIENELRDTLEQVAKENLRLADTNCQLGSAVGELKGEVEDLNSTVKELTKAKDEISEAKQRLVLGV